VLKLRSVRPGKLLTRISEIGGVVAFIALVASPSGRDFLSERFYPVGLIVALGLACSTLLALNLLGRRASDVGAPSLDATLLPRAYQASFEESLGGATSVWIAAKGLDAFLHSHGKAIVAAQRNGVVFRFLMHDPEDPSLMAAMARMSYSHQNPKDVRKRLRSSADAIRGMADVTPGTVELRLTSWPMTYGCTLFDPEAERASAYLEMFGYRLSLNERRGFSVEKASDPSTYSFMLDGFRTQWRDGRDGLVC
jgi:hypothetical protein